MPLFEIQGPDGSTYEVDAPDQGAAVAAFQKMPAPAAPPAPRDSMAMDALKSARAGLAEGVAGFAGIGGDIAAAIGADKAPGTDEAIQQVTGGKQLPQWLQDAQSRVQGAAPALRAPTTQEIVGAAEQATGMPIQHEPQFPLGKYTKTATQFVPGAMLGPGNVARNVGLYGLGAGAASEAAGQATQGSNYEPYARLGAAIAAPIAAQRLITPLPARASRNAMVQALEAEGVPMTAGQRTGNRPLQWTESALGDMPFAGGRPAEIADAQGRAFTAAALRRTGEQGADLATPEVMTRVGRRLGNDFEQLSARNNMNFDADFAQDIGNTLQRYGRLLDAQQSAIVQREVNDLIGRAQQHGGILPGTEYQSIRSDLSRNAKSNQSELGNAFRGIRNALDAAMRRSMPAADREAWDVARQQYGSYKAIERAVGGAGSATAEGYLSPSQLRGAVRQGEGAQRYARGQGEMTELARAGEGVLRPLPQSGTAPRSLITALMGAAGAAGGNAAGLGMEALAAGAAVPAVLGRALMNPAVQRYLGNQAIPAMTRDQQIARALIASPVAAEPLLAEIKKRRKSGSR